MKPKHQRIVFLGLGVLMVSLAIYLILSAFEDNIVFFYTPSQLYEKNIQLNRRIRLGGMVVKGSLKKDGLNSEFKVSDSKKIISVNYHGVFPDLFREGQGVVMEGELTDFTHFKAKMVLAKHDENYMPPQVGNKMHKKSKERS